ncbi:MAG: saccharopine dehydrogenase family protein [Flavobacteriales bacterium]
MRTILVIGAGRSSSTLIKYLLNNAETEGWKVRVGDMDVSLAATKINNHHRGEAFVFNATDSEQCEKEVKAADLVISMLPAHMHVEIAKDCIKYKKHLVTPSYITQEMKSLHDEAVRAGILIMNELGVDPGIDHLSAKKILDEIQEMGGEMVIFESFTGGLVAPESDNNPWNYKFTWNPRNVVLAGQGGAAKFIQEGMYKYIPYHKLFRRTEFITIEGYGKFEGYANRDSLKYRSVYGLENIPTIYRGTLRRPGFCRAWDLFVQLGATDDSYIMDDTETMTHRDFINSFLAYNPWDSVELKLRHYLKIDQDDPVWEKLEWLGIFDNITVGIKNATPAQVLQSILEKKWALEPTDKDMIVMWHKFGFRLNDEDREIQSSMVAVGKDQTYTAMSDTVGLPIAIATKLIMNGTIKLTGTHLPLQREVYLPILEELEQYGIHFVEKEVEPKFYSGAE